MKMRVLNALFCFLVLVSCTKNDNKSNAQDDNKSDVKHENKFDECFSSLDITNYGFTVGCSGGYYKLLNDHQVLRIQSYVDIGYDECQEIEIKDKYSIVIAELLVFKPGEASLMNLCTDVIVANAPNPINRIPACSGEIIVGKSDPTDYYGKEMPRFSFYIEELTFPDFMTFDTIKIKNEILWKVLDVGTPG